MWIGIVLHYMPALTQSVKALQHCLIGWEHIYILCSGTLDRTYKSTYKFPHKKMLEDSHEIYTSTCTFHAYMQHLDVIRWRETL